MESYINCSTSVLYRKQLFGRKMPTDVGCSLGHVATRRRCRVEYCTGWTRSTAQLTLSDPNIKVTDNELKNVSGNKVLRIQLIGFASKRKHTAPDLINLLQG